MPAYHPPPASWRTSPSTNAAYYSGPGIIRVVPPSVLFRVASSDRCFLVFPWPHARGTRNGCGIEGIANNRSSLSFSQVKRCFEETNVERLQALFVRPSAIRRMRSCLFGAHLDEFYELLLEQGFRKRTIRNKLSIVAHFSRWMVRKDEYHARRLRAAPGLYSPLCQLAQPQRSTYRGP